MHIYIDMHELGKLCKKKYRSENASNGNDSREP